MENYPKYPLNDANGNKTEECSYGFNGSLKFKETYKYDNIGNLIMEEIRVGDADILQGGKIYEYEYY